MEKINYWSIKVPVSKSVNTALNSNERNKLRNGVLKY